MRGWKVSWESLGDALTNVMTGTHTRDMTNTAAAIKTITELCAVPELTVIVDADGRTLTKQCSGQPTTNSNWIFWEANGVFLHSDEVALPAAIDFWPPAHEHVWVISTTTAPRCECGQRVPKMPKRKGA